MVTVRRKRQHCYTILFQEIHSSDGQVRVMVIEKIGLPGEHFTCSKKCLHRSKKWTTIIHPEEFALSILPGGALFNICCLKFTVGNIKYGGPLFPIAENAAAKVTNVPFSWEVILPIRLKPLLATIRSGFCSVVSSMLYKPWGPVLR